MRLADHIIQNFNNNMSTAAVFMDIEKAFDKTWHFDLLYKFSELAFSKRLIKLIASFISNRTFKILVEGEFLLQEIGVPQGCVLAPILYILYINDAPAAPGSRLVLLADDTCTRIYTTGKHEGCVLCKLQRGLSAVKSWYERWNIQELRRSVSPEDLRVPQDVLQLNGRDIPFVDNVACLGVTFDRRMT
jgi:hypothetical protein